jgi:transposase
MDEAGPFPKVLIADKGCDRDAIHDNLAETGVTPIIPNSRNGKVQEPVDGFIYALGNQIERCFSRLRQNQRIATRYDKTADG